jgi:hypothetical protein
VLIFAALVPSGRTACLADDSFIRRIKIHGFPSFA